MTTVDNDAMIGISIIFSYILILDISTGFYFLVLLFLAALGLLSFFIFWYDKVFPEEEDPQQKAILEYIEKVNVEETTLKMMSQEKKERDVA